VMATYGNALAEAHAFDESTAPHRGRVTRLPAPEIFWCGADGQWTEHPSDGAWLRLTRYHGGTKGPVLLAPGFGMSTAAFATDTIPTNLAEYLVEHDYDVWLFDFRWSPDLASSRTKFSIDDIATVDWPAAVDEVRRRTGAADVQVVAHCVGSMSLLMAVLAGMQGVRAAVCSQVTTHPVMTRWNRGKTVVRTGRVLQGLGLRTIQPDAAPTLADQALDLLLRVSPVDRDERCNSAVCRWIFAFYGPTHHHGQLNQATHEDMARLFGVADLDALNHISRMIRTGHSVDEHGADVYLPHVERLDLPILFLAGNRNRIFLPETSARTLQWLEAANGKGKYRRVVLDDYAHLDGFIGRNADRDVFPHILEHLEGAGLKEEKATPGRSKGRSQAGGR
jgi:cholesterol oxidase